jgi:hypothetical protein
MKQTFYFEMLGELLGTYRQGSNSKQAITTSYRQYFKKVQIN